MSPPTAALSTVSTPVEPKPVVAPREVFAPVVTLLNASRADERCLCFEDWFWGSKNDPIFGINRLHENAQRGLVEVDEMATCLQAKSAAELVYAKSIQDIGQLPPKPAGFGQDESLIAQVLTSYKFSLVTQASAHLKMVQALNEGHQQVISFSERFKKSLVQEHDEIVTLCKAMLHAKIEYKRYKASYYQLCREADAAEAAAAVATPPKRASLTSPVSSFALALASARESETRLTFGGHKFAVAELNAVLAKAQQDLRPQDIRTLLGTYSQCYLGEELALSIQGQCQITQAEAQAILDDLASNNFLKLVHRRPSFYQWRKFTVDANEPPAKKARREADRVDREYRQSVRTAEAARIKLEQACIQYMRNCEAFEVERLALFDDCMRLLNDAPSDARKIAHDLAGRNRAILSHLDPIQQVQSWIEKEKTSFARMLPFVYENDQTGCTHVFGVSLEKVTNPHPPALTRCPAAIDPATCSPFISMVLDVLPTVVRRDNLTAQQQAALWMAPIAHTVEAYQIRSVVDRHRKTARRRLLASDITSSALIGATQLYLIQLPISVCPHEIYEPLKILYLSKTEQDMGTLRIGSLKSLLATLPTCYFQTLKALTIYWWGLARELECLRSDTDLAPDTQSAPNTHDASNSHNTQEPSELGNWDAGVLDKRDNVSASDLLLAQRLGLLVLRPAEADRSHTLQDKHPVRLMQDLLTLGSQIFDFEHADYHALFSTDVPVDVASDSEDDDQHGTASPTWVPSLPTSSSASNSRSQLRLASPTAPNGAQSTPTVVNTVKTSLLHWGEVSRERLGNLPTSGSLSGMLNISSMWSTVPGVLQKSNIVAVGPAPATPSATHSRPAVSEASAATTSDTLLHDQDFDAEASADMPRAGAPFPSSGAERRAAIEPPTVSTPSLHVEGTPVAAISPVSHVPHLHNPWDEVVPPLPDFTSEAKHITDMVDEILLSNLALSTDELPTPLRSEPDSFNIDHTLDVDQLHDDFADFI
ncbi:hypothetical protein CAUPRSCDRAFT_10979 [Caulochytrium protostelioides]|nr:hypothetical protein CAUPRSCDRAFT_10979 [Caulochytrium protostelioides]